MRRIVLFTDKHRRKRYTGYVSLVGRWREGDEVDCALFYDTDCNRIDGYSGLSYFLKKGMMTELPIIQV